MPAAAESKEMDEDVTAEARIRQLEAKAIALLGHQYAERMLPLRLSVWSALRELGGAATSDEMLEVLRRVWWTPPDSRFLVRVLAPFPEFRIIKDVRVIAVAEQVVA